MAFHIPLIQNQNILCVPLLHFTLSFSLFLTFAYPVIFIWRLDIYRLCSNITLSLSLCLRLAESRSEPDNAALSPQEVSNENLLPICDDEFE